MRLMPDEVSIRLAEQRDIDQLVEVIVRQKRLNEEFDPLLSVSPALVENARRYIEEAINSQRSVLLVAVRGEKVVGLLKADVVERVFYEPPLEGIIREFYIMPEYRRRGLGKEMLSTATKHLKEKGARLITAEFPSQHKIAVAFYEDLGFRPIISIYARETEK